MRDISMANGVSFSPGLSPRPLGRGRGFLSPLTATPPCHATAADERTGGAFIFPMPIAYGKKIWGSISQENNGFYGGAI